MLIAYVPSVVSVNYTTMGGVITFIHQFIAEYIVLATNVIFSRQPKEYPLKRFELLEIIA